MNWSIRVVVAGLVLVVLGFTGLPRQGATEEAKIRLLLVTGHDVLPAHNWRQTTERLRTILEKDDRFDVKICEDTGIFESTSLDRYDVIVNNFGFWTAPELTPKAREGLLGFVRNGKGLMSLHFACSSYQGWEGYKDLIGRIWKKDVGGHGPRGKFQVKIEKPSHPIVAGLSDFEMDDELYAKLTGDAEIEVLASAASDWSGKVEPIVFVKSYGKGRVVQNVLGHDLKAMENLAYETLIRRGAEWAATGRVTMK